MIPVLIAALLGVTVGLTAGTESVDEPPELDNRYVTVGAEDSVPRDESGGGGGGDEPVEEPWVCRRSPANVAGAINNRVGDFQYSTIDLMYWRFDRANGIVWLRTYESCTRGDEVRNRTFWDRQTDPDPSVFLPGLVDEVTEKVFFPVPALSPTERGVVKLGMWLAVDEQAAVTARASASAMTWAETTARQMSTTFDFGNGDVVVCEGAGVPIPDWAIDSVEEGPCGYTFTSTNDGEPFVVTITATWSVVSTTSAGTVVTHPDLELVTTVDYPVVEIQTVGVGNP